ncbi:MAG: hypothetical protein QNJ38_24205 [Prochloraceae cyanobacterium]|nr:hypothetical protein [Prochloraceae cyanobacterium]
MTHFQQRSILLSITPVPGSQTMLQSDYQVKIDRKTFDLMLDCLIANAGGDAACKLLLDRLEKLGLSPPQDRFKEVEISQSQLTDVIFLYQQTEDNHPTKSYSLLDRLAA